MSASHKKSTYRMSREGLDNREEHSIIYWIVMGFALMFLFTAPFQTALFYGFKVQYERPIYTFFVWVAIVLLLVSVYLFNRWRLREIRDWYALAIWAVPLSYLLASFSAASAFNAKNLLLLHVMYAVFFLIGLFFARNQLGYTTLQYAILFSAYAVVWFCYMNMFGNTYFQDAVMREGEGNIRLTSVFQYANAYAGFLIIPILCGLYLIVSSRKWYVTAIHSFMLVPVLLAFFLTLSRGGLVMLPFILLAFLPFLSFARQMLFFVYLLIGSGASLLITDKIRTVSLEVLDKMLRLRGPDMKVKDPLSVFDSLSFSGWGTLLLASAVTCAVIVLIQRFAVPYVDKGLGRVSRARFANLYVPALIVVGVVLGGITLAGQSNLARVLPEAIAQRVESINLQQHSVLERFTMYRDTFKVLKDYPVFGAGGGAWGFLYPKYANNPYTVNQVHSFLLQYMVETGIFGLLVLLSLLGSIFYLFARRYFSGQSEDARRGLMFYAVVVAILFHSLMDFDMSYAYISALVFLCLGGLAAGFSEPAALGKREIETNAGKGSKANQSQKHWLKYAYPAALGVVAILFFIQSAVQLKANGSFFKAIELNNQRKMLPEVMVPLNESVRLQKGNPYYSLTKAEFMENAYAQTNDEMYYEEAATVLANIRSKESYDTDLFNSEYNLYLAKSRWEDALALMQQGLEHYPWVINMYERTAALHFQLGDQARVEDKKDVMNKHWDAALQLKDDIGKRMKHLETLPKEQNPGQPFYITPSLGLTFGQIYFIRGDNEKAVEMLKTTANPSLDNEQTRGLYQSGTRWYLAALKASNKMDQALYDQFTAKYPQEKQEIERLVTAVWH